MPGHAPRTLVAADVMTPEPICADRSDTVHAIIRMLNDHEISGVPVTDANGRAVGAVSRADILRKALDGGSRAPAFLFEMLRDSDQDFAELPDESVTTVEDLMTPDPACVGVDTPATEIARLMAERRIHRVIVTDRVGIPVGIVTSLDLLEVFPAESAARARAGS